MREPVLVSSMDGVGTKLLVARAARRYDTVGQDLVNHCVNDIGVTGAEPLFFLDYVGVGKLDPERVLDLVRGLATACARNGCALIGGETAEMPGVYRPPDFDLVGCIVGTARRDAWVDGSAIRPGDVVLGLPSTGLHTNGFSLARKVLFEEAGLEPGDLVPGTGVSVADALLAVHRSYLPEFRKLRGIMKGAAHITGGGIPGNLNRILPRGVAAMVHVDRSPVPPIFRLIAERGNLAAEDLFPTFNMGTGLLVVVDAARVEEARRLLGTEAWVAGGITEGDGDVRLLGDPSW
jgi:phosphoribosylformylglycinamidine cyclo-ligase